MFSSITVGAIPLSRRSRTTVRPVGPKPNDHRAVVGIVRCARHAGLSGRRGVDGRPVQQRHGARPVAIAQRSSGRIARYAIGLSTIDAMEAATSTFVASAPEHV